MRKFLKQNVSNAKMRNPIMKCDQLNKNLIGYIEQIIPIDLMDEMTIHIQECNNCKALYENIAATYTILDKQSLPQLNLFFYTRLEQRLIAKNQHVQSAWPKVTWKLQPLAATFLVLIGISVGILIGKSASGSGISFRSPDRSEVLKAYASDYYITSNEEENMSVLMNNE